MEALNLSSLVIIIIGVVGTILMSFISILLAFIWNGMEKRAKKTEETQEKIEKAIHTLSEKIDDKVSELAKCLTNLEEQLALQEKSTENLVIEFTKMRGEIADLKKQMDSISMQYSSLKEAHTWLFKEQESQKKKLEEIEKKLNEVYFKKRDI